MGKSFQAEMDLTLPMGFKWRRSATVEVWDVILRSLNIKKLRLASKVLNMEQSLKKCENIDYLA